MDAKRFIEILSNSGFEPRSYSGRGMYGKACVGVDLDSSKSLFSVGMDVAYAIVDECESTGEDPADTLAEICNLRAREDSMGLGSIVYFPKLEWPSDLTSDE